MGEQEEKRTFNLVKEPWIPVSGVGDVSLRDIFAHPEYCRLGGNAVEKVVILRLLLCIVHACCEVNDEDDWRKLTLDQLAQNALAYLEKYQDRFDLYDEQKPFLQFPQLKGHCVQSTLGAVALQVARGNKTVLTQWHQLDTFTPAETVRLLLVGTAYGCGGKKYDSAAKIDPKGPAKGKSAPPCPLTGYAGYLHSYMLGETILETLQLNMLTLEELQKLNSLSNANPLGRPFWEAMPTDESGPTAKAYRDSYQGVLFPLSKYFCLDGDSLLMTEGIAYPNHKAGQWDPGITLYAEKKDTKALWCNTEKRPWRQLPALLKFMAADCSDTMPAFLVLGIPKLRKAQKETFGIWTGGVAMSNQTGEQYVSGTDDYMDSEFSIPWSWTQEQSFTQYKTLMELVDLYARRLYGAVLGYFDKLMSDNKDSMAACATRLFWERMEPLAQEIIDLSEADAQTEAGTAALEEAKRKWQDIARACYRQFCPSASPRQIQLFIKHSPYFGEKTKGEGTKDSENASETETTTTTTAKSKSSRKAKEAKHA